MDFINELQTNPWTWMITAVITIASLILAYISTPQKKLRFFITDNELIENKNSALSGLSVLYNGSIVDNITVTKIAFWNDSFPTINDVDIVKTNPLSATLKNGTILSASVLYGEFSNNINLSEIKDNKTILRFDYLDRKEGGIIQLVHTGKQRDVKIEGKLKGGNVKSASLHIILIFLVISFIFSFVLCIVLDKFHPDFIWLLFPSDWLTAVERVTIKSDYRWVIFVAFFIMLILLCYDLIYLLNGYMPRKLRNKYITNRLVKIKKNDKL